MAGDKPKSWANILNPSTGQVSSDASPPSSNSPDKPVIQSNPRSQAIRNTRYCAKRNSILSGSLFFVNSLYI